MDVKTFEATEAINRKTYQERYCNPDNRRCKAGCPFWRPLHQHVETPDYFCAYLLMTRHMRNTETGQCDMQTRIQEYEDLPEPAKLPYGRQHYPTPEFLLEEDTCG